MFASEIVDILKSVAIIRPDPSGWRLTVHGRPEGLALSTHDFHIANLIRVPFLKVPLDETFDTHFLPIFVNPTLTFTTAMTPAELGPTALARQLHYPQ